MNSPFDMDEDALRIEDAALSMRIREFIKRWEPEDRHYRLDFERDLHEIVRAIYVGAQRPLLNQISHWMARLPMPPAFITKPFK